MGFDPFDARNSLYRPGIVNIAAEGIHCIGRIDDNSPIAQAADNLLNLTRFGRLGVNMNKFRGHVWKGIKYKRVKTVD